MTGAPVNGQGPATPGRRIPRALHPAAWWLWAFSLAVTTSEYMAAARSPSEFEPQKR